MAQLKKDLHNVESWTKFLKHLAIPEQQSLEYANTFADNRITGETLTDLTAEHLRQLNITALGDILIISRRVKSLSAQPPVLPFPAAPIALSSIKLHLLPSSFLE